MVILDVENEDILSGKLDIYLVRDVELITGNVKDGNRFLGIDFHGGDWKALFFRVLDCPKYTWPPIEHEEYRERFQKHLADYPMLGRIWDMYEDALYRAEEVEAFRKECLRVQMITSNGEALAGLRKLIFACDEASKAGTGIGLIAD